MNILKASWVQRRWLDFRNGHAVYLVFPMTFLNFVVIFYTLALERIPILKEIFPSMGIWITFFTALYVPLAIGIGHFHMKRQVPNEVKQNMEVNPYIYQTTPGKEQMYSLPATVIAIDLQLKGMEINNQTADAFKSLAGVDILKWSAKDIEMVKWQRNVTVGLQNGENIKDILLKYPEPTR